MKQQAVEENVFSLQQLKKKLPFSSGNYPYVCARVRAKRALLLKQDTYAKLLMMDVHEITRFLGESHYKDEIAELGLTYTGFELTEQALNRDLDEVYHQILGFCDGDLYTMLAAYLQREDIWNIKTILRGKLYNAKTEDIMRTIRAAGRYSEEYWRSLIQRSKTVEETIENLKGNIYFDTIHALKEEWTQHPDECENTLHKVYYQQLLDVVQSRSQPMMLFRDYIRREIDLVNLKTLFMTKYESVEPDKIRSMLIPGGDLLERTLDTLVDAPDFSVFLEFIQKLPFSSPIKETLRTISETGSLTHVIRVLEKEHLTRATKSSYLYPLSILPILDYLIRKKIEVENLRILARGKEKGLADDLLREMLVM